MIVIFTNQHDLTVDLGILAFRRWGLPYQRINTEIALPTLTLEREGEASQRVADLDFREVRAVWYRRPVFSLTNSDLPALEGSFVEEERRAAWFNAFEALRAHPWFNWPDDNRRAGRRISMLSTALQCGLAVPTSQVVSDAVAARAFVRRVGSTVVKCVGAGFRDDAGGRAAFAHVIEHAQQVPEDIGAAPVLLQAFIPKIADWRITVFGKKVVAVRLDSQAELTARVDWRQSERPLAMHWLPLPDSVMAGLQKFMMVTRLRFGAFDFVEDTTGQLWFLEVNPNGQWGWMEQEAGIPLSDALAEALSTAMQEQRT